MTAVRWWVGSSILGLVVSSALLALSLRDEAVRIRAGANGALAITTRASVVLKAQFTAYFALCLAAATASRAWRVRLLVMGNLVLTAAALYRLKVRRDLIRWSGKRNRRWSDLQAVEILSKEQPPRDPRAPL